MTPLLVALLVSQIVLCAVVAWLFMRLRRLDDDLAVDELQLNSLDVKVRDLQGWP